VGISVAAIEATTWEAEASSLYLFSTGSTKAGRCRTLAQVGEGEGAAREAAGEEAVMGRVAWAGLAAA